MIVGFTGTQQGMTSEQVASVRHLLARLVSGTSPQVDGTEFWHGNEAHSDTQAAKIAKELRYKTIAWPGDTPEKQGDFESDVTMPVMPNLVRNKVIGRESDVLIAAPHRPEYQRSGTWSTVRRAREAGTPVHIVMPDGEEYA